MYNVGMAFKTASLVVIAAAALGLLIGSTVPLGVAALVWCFAALWIERARRARS